MTPITTAWVLALLRLTEPAAPWKDTYPTTAAAMASAANAAPIFPGEDGPARTASVLVSVSWFESRHKPNAEGDRPCLEQSAGKCVKRGEPRAFCLGQIWSSNFRALGTSRVAIQSDVGVCVAAMLTVLRKSLQVCASAQLEDRLSWYATGRAGCAPVRESAHRMRKASWLLTRLPFDPLRFADAPGA